LRSPFITVAPRERRREAVARPMPEEPPFFLCQEGRSEKGCGDVIPVMRTTLPLMVCRSASLMITSAMFADR
jgi:hypothetical protein